MQIFTCPNTKEEQLFSVLFLIHTKCKCFTLYSTALTSCRFCKVSLSHPQLIFYYVFCIHTAPVHVLTQTLINILGKVGDSNCFMYYHIETTKQNNLMYFVLIVYKNRQIIINFELTINLFIYLFFVCKEQEKNHTCLGIACTLLAGGQQMGCSCCWKVKALRTLLLLHPKIKINQLICWPIQSHSILFCSVQFTLIWTIAVQLKFKSNWVPSNVMKLLFSINQVD